jgi:hypothetical protein
VLSTGVVRRLLPRSLQGQMLLSVALALLVAQVLAGVLLFRAERQRQENNAINNLAFQLVSAERTFDDPARQRRFERRERRVQRLMQSPLVRGGGLRDEPREAALRQVLEEQDVAIAELVVLTREVAADRALQQRLCNVPPPPP